MRSAATRVNSRAMGKRATQHFAQAIDFAEMLDHPNSLAHGLHNVGIGHQLGG